jgi:hypothetical protein
MAWHSYPEADSPLIPTIVKQVADVHGATAELVNPNSVRVYCTKDTWINLLFEVARRIYRNDT